MRDIERLLCKGLTGSIFFLLIVVGTIVQAQGRMTIQATAMGTSTQLGRLYNVNILIEKFSTADDQQTLIAAFKRSGQDGLIDVLEDMKPKGRVRFASGGVGNDVKYIIELPYSVGAIELVLTPDGKGSGTVLPACKLRVNKKTKQIEIETYQNPWKLSNFIISND
ncbi:MAG: hypothetical protein DMG64_17145 [Acidobacteria bacterium]|nr:MAG: hypothetical protein DMG64_17145 [Acidobacteriota bacterium]